MRIIVEDSAKKYLEKSNETEISILLSGCSAWGPAEPQPLVVMGKPLDDIDDYDVYEDNGIKVYVRVDVIAKDDEIKILYKKILFTGSLIAQGIEI